MLIRECWQTDEVSEKKKKRKEKEETENKMER